MEKLLKWENVFILVWSLFWAVLFSNDIVSIGVLVFVVLPLGVAIVLIKTRNPEKVTHTKDG